jgi:hypothetical protein
VYSWLVLGEVLKADNSAINFVHWPNRFWKPGRGQNGLYIPKAMLLEGSSHRISPRRLTSGSRLASSLYGHTDSKNSFVAAAAFLPSTLS